MSQKSVLLISLSVLGLVGALWYAEVNPSFLESKRPASKESRLSPSTPQMSMKGVDIVDGEGGRPFFRLHIGRLEVNRKKLGFFRLGSMNELNLWNVQLDLYADSIREERRGRAGSTGSESDSEAGQESFLEREIMGSLRLAAGLKNPVAGFEASNVRLNIHRGEGPTLEIRAASLKPDGQKCSLVMSGHVVLDVDGDQQRHGQIVFDPEALSLKTSGGGVLEVFPDSRSGTEPSQGRKSAAGHGPGPVQDHQDRPDDGASGDAGHDKGDRRDFGP